MPGASRSAHISDTLFQLSSISQRYDEGEKPQRESKKPEKETALCKQKKKISCIIDALNYCPIEINAKRNSWFTLGCTQLKLRVLLIFNNSNNERK